MFTKVVTVDQQLAKDPYYKKLQTIQRSTLFREHAKYEPIIDFVKLMAADHRATITGGSRDVKGTAHKAAHALSEYAKTVGEANPRFTNYCLNAGLLMAQGRQFPMIRQFLMSLYSQGIPTDMVICGLLCPWQGKEKFLDYVKELVCELKADLVASGFLADIARIAGSVDKWNLLSVNGFDFNETFDYNKEDVRGAIESALKGQPDISNRALEMVMLAFVEDQDESDTAARVQIYPWEYSDLPVEDLPCFPDPY